MGNVAASGGYYVSAQAKHIMSQRATLTGSIGVIAARASTQALYEKVKVNQVSIQKGKRANLYSDLAPLSIEERQIFWDSIVHTYEDFKRIVAQGRDLPFEDLDAICEGRVWTGRQAETHKLVDSHGDFIDAVEEAATMAALEFEHAGQIRVANLMNKNDDYVLPRPNETVQEISRLLSREWVKELNGRPLTLMPFSLDLD
jgi:protease-4